MTTWSGRLTDSIRGELAASLWTKEYDNDMLAVSAVSQYPDGEPVEVFVRRRADGTVDVTDMAEMARWALGRGFSDERAHKVIVDVSERAGIVCQGLTMLRQSVMPKDVPRAVFDVVNAASRAADALVFSTRAPYTRGEFRHTVADTIVSQFPAFVTERELQGASGRRFKVAAYEPGTHTVVQTVASPRVGLIGVAYAEMADIRQVNGYKTVLVIDDTEEEWSNADEGLLAQVARVAQWKQRNIWLPELVAA